LVLMSPPGRPAQVLWRQVPACERLSLSTGGDRHPPATACPGPGFGMSPPGRLALFLVRQVSAGERLSLSGVGRYPSACAFPGPRCGRAPSASACPCSRLGRNPSASACPSSRFGRIQSASACPSPWFGRIQSASAWPSPWFGRSPPERPLSRPGVLRVTTGSGQDPPDVSGVSLVPARLGARPSTSGEEPCWQGLSLGLCRLPP
jgi:hypothetical protein